MESEYSSDGVYYAVINQDGKLKVWETSTSILKHEYTPSLHLSQPCTCIKWIHIANTQSPWRKRKRTDSKDHVNSAQCLALGTKSGTVLVYSPFESKILQTLGSSNDSSVAIDCLTWAKHSGLISCGGYYITRWNISDGSVKSKWKNDKNELIRSAVVIENKPHLLTATRSIKMWDFETKELLQTFTGHASEVKFLKCVPALDDGVVNYFVSGAKTDRFLSCWSLNDKVNSKNAVAKFVMEDISTFVSIGILEDKSMTMAATSHSGVVHIYKQTLNGKSSKPIKPKVTIQIASDNNKNKDIIQIPILTAYVCDGSSVLLGYGAYYVTVFEKIVVSLIEKIQCLVRTDPRKLKTQHEDVTKTKTPDTQNHVEYLTPVNVSSKSTHTTSKRKIEPDSFEVPMEKRLENLVLSKPVSGSVPKSDNVANLLIQGLHSKDKNILYTVFSKTDETIVRNTIKRLPVQILNVLVKELTAIIQGKTEWSRCGAIWLKHLIHLHASQLLANPELNDIMNPVLGFISNRVNLLSPLSQLRGRLDLLVTQVSNSITKDDFEQTPLVYQDTDSEDSSSDDNIEMNIQSDTDDQWDENEMNDSSSNDDENEDDGETAGRVGDLNNDEDSDVEMS